MKLNRRNFLLISSAASLIHSKPSLAFINSEQHMSPALKPLSVDGKQLSVYTTAHNSNHRISLTDTLSFKPAGQPKETQTCVFVDPAKQFQTFLGIGGALTDAAAEVFAALPSERQEEILTAYFDDKKGIGYRLAA